MAAPVSVLATSHGAVRAAVRARMLVAGLKAMEMSPRVVRHAATACGSVPLRPHKASSSTRASRDRFSAGVYTAVVTPFNAAGEVDWMAYETLLRQQIAAGVAGIVPCGTTGESSTLTAVERSRLISEAVKLCRGTGCQVVAGTGSNDTAKTVATTADAQAAGVDGVMIVNPYYNRPSQAGLIAHFTAVAAVGVPIMLYNSGRSGVNLAPSTVAELRRRLPAVAAIKEASGSVEQASAVAAACDIPILSGDDGLTVPMMSVGAVGVVSVVSNLLPAEVVAMVDAAAAGDYGAARAAHYRLLPFFTTMFVETNPVPIKRAMQLAGLIPSAAVRLPLVGLAAESDTAVVALLRERGMLRR